MNRHTYVFTSSRGHCFEDKIKCRCIQVIPGGKLKYLCDLAFDQLRYVQGEKLVYFIAGIPDICTKERDKKHNYDESYLQLRDNNGNEVDHISSFTKQILHVESVMKRIHCKVVFATITTMSFEVWNNLRYAQRKTSYLKYSERYEYMQNKLNSSLNVINNFITEVNTRNGVLTPFLHSPVQKCKKGKTRYAYSKLSDGVHPGYELAETWVIRLKGVISQNETNL